MSLVGLLLGVFVFVAYTVETMMGFGAIVIGLSLGAMIMPIREVLPVLLPLSVCMGAYLVIKHRRFIDSQLLLKTIIPMMLVGMAIGYILVPFIDTQMAKQIFGAFVLWFAIKELWMLIKKPQVKLKQPIVVKVLTLAAGIFHGIFAAGGPIVVYALAGMSIDKARMRATLLSTWLVLNSLLCLVFIIEGRISWEKTDFVYYFPALIFGIIVGERLHRYCSEQQFKLLIYLLLVIAGVLLLVPR